MAHINRDICLYKWENSNIVPSNEELPASVITLDYLEHFHLP